MKMQHEDNPAHIIIAEDPEGNCRMPRKEGEQDW